MNKGVLAEKLVISFSACLLVAAFLTGCPSPASNSAVSVNAPVNKEKTPGQKTEQASSGTGATQKAEMLWDFRKIDDSKAPDFPKAETAAVLKYLVGDSPDSSLEITSRVAGAFTKPNAKETLYFVTGCKDEAGKFVSNATCGHVAWNTAGWIAVFDGTTPVLKTEEPLGGAIEKVSDVNGDGVNEILSIGGYTGMGIVTESAVLGQISGGKFEEIKTFRGYADNCGDGLSKDKTAIAAVIGYAKTADGKLPEFSEEHFLAACEGDGLGDNPQWNKITKQQFDEFFDSIS